MDKQMVLVIEDDELNQKLVKEILRVGNYRSIEAMDAETGIQLARRHKPDLILMDVHLPMPEDLKKALEAGCDDYVTKPFRIQDLLKTIDQLLSSGKGNIMGDMKDDQG